MKFQNRDFLCSDLELYPRVRRTPHTLSACGPDGLFIGRRKNDAGPLGWLRNPNYPISDLVINLNGTYGPLWDFLFFRMVFIQKINICIHSMESLARHRSPCAPVLAADLARDDAAV